MASPLGSHIPFPCPACAESMTVPVKEVGRDGDVLTVALDLGPFRGHIADAHGTARPHPDTPGA